MRIALITEAALNQRHGTGAQLLRYLDGTELNLAHIFFLGWAGWQSDYKRSLSLAQPEWLERHHRLRSLARRLGFYWWRYGGLRHSTRAAIQVHATPCDVAWVVVGGERGASVARRIVAELRAPVLLHMMDLYADSLDACPHLTALAREAAGLIALTPTLREELCRVTGRDCMLLEVGQKLDVPQAYAPTSAGWNLLLTGRPYSDSLNLLQNALRLLPPGKRPRSICYPSSLAADIPAELSPGITQRAFIPDSAHFARLVAEQHIAYLQLPTQLDHFGRYSYPSRVTDYLMAGLPVVGHSPLGSAAEAVLSAAHPGVRLSHTGPAEIAANLATISATPAAWLEAHRAARTYAERHLDITTKQPAICAALARCIVSPG
jgi:hypothetical protein